MLKNPCSKALALYLVIALFALSFPAQGWAMHLPAEKPDARTADLATVRTTLESLVIKQRLLDYGLTPEETIRRIEALSDEQIHQFASHLDVVQTGGSSVGGDVIFILLIILIVIVILELTGHKVVMRR